MGVKCTYFLAHKSMVETIKRDHKLQSIPLTIYMITPWFSRKRIKIKCLCWEKHLNSFENRDKELNETQNNMVQVIFSLIKVINMVLKLNKGKDHIFPQQNFEEQYN